MSKLLHHLQHAIGAAILTLFCIILIRSAGLPDYIHRQFFPDKELSDSELFEGNSNSETEEARIRTSDSYEKRMAKGDQYAEKQLVELAITEYTAASQLKPSELEPYIKTAKIHLNNANLDKALEVAQRAYQADPNNSQSVNIYLEAALRNDKLIVLDEEVLNQEFNDAENYYWKAIIAAIQSDHKIAQDHLMKASSLTPLGHVAEQINIYLRTYKEFDSTQAVDPNYLKALISQNLIQDNIYIPTIRILYEVIKEDYNYRDAWIMLGYSFLKTKSYFDAIEALQTALDIDPIKTESRYFLGLAYFGAEKYTDAISNIEIAIENGFQPKLEALQQLAEIAILNEEYEKAYEAYSQVIELQPRDLDLYIRPIWLLIEKLDRAEESIIIAQKAVEYQANDAFSYNLLGWAQTAAAQYDEAKLNLEKSIELDPSLAAAYLNLGWWFAVQEEYKQAMNYYVSAYKLDSEGPVGHLAAERYNEIVSSEN